jgi:hypothetical protein
MPNRIMDTRFERFIATHPNASPQELYCAGYIEGYQRKEKQEDDVDAKLRTLENKKFKLEKKQLEIKGRRVQEALDYHESVLRDLG